MARKADSDDQFSPEEVKHRFEAALRGARIAGPKPMKDVPRKRAESKAQKTKAELKAGKTRRAVVAADTVKKKKAAKPPSR